ncbi:MAG: alanine--tRNA ligase [Betaproteobacteria bacterium]|nr:alanine--tRNA ligase [Betaproteobacteria bacterium]
MSVTEIRQRFLDFFAQNGHAVVPSSALVPANDPTLLFTNSGMVQFKDVFLGREKRAYSRATSSQRSVRAGGKHNDLENVGYTARHHTFFEMLGNFSFGDYFKQDAIRYAWTLLTDVYGLPKERLWVTVYQDDDEAYGIWEKEIGVPVERIVRIGDNKGARYASDNFWQMADTGPCGPCSEIFYDHGPAVWGGPPGSPEGDGDRYIEIWNLVFMQYDRDEKGVLTPLPKPCVDTGMGLERIAAVLQGVHSNYEIDLFANLVADAARETGCKDLSNPSLRVIADHIRACSFLIVDGVIPGNEGRGYVLRRIVRRALRHGHKLGQTQPFFFRLVKDLVDQMGGAYPELAQAATRVADTLRQEEERFGETLEKGMAILSTALADLPKGGMLDGQTAFMLYDTFGFPLDLTADVCREREVAVDEAGFEQAMDRQRDQARAASKFKSAGGLEYNGVPTAFVGYESLSQSARVTGLYVGGSAVEAAGVGDEVVVVLETTPFYAESGGQVGDAGQLKAEGLLVQIEDTQKISAEVFGHHGRVIKGPLRIGQNLVAEVDLVRRARTARHHSVTHIMHKALREVLGAHVQQKGSLVDADKTRFDFAHNQPLTAQEIERIEAMVNEEVLRNTPTQAQVMGFDDAVAGGAVALFGEKYGDVVRVLDIGSSRELCGGTHVARTGDIGIFKIVSESGVAAGIRRVEAITGDRALSFMQSLEQQLHEAAGLMKTAPAELGSRLSQLLESSRQLEKELSRLKAKLAASAGDDLASQAVSVGGAKFLATTVEGVASAELRSLLDSLKSKLQSAAIVLASVEGEKVSIIAGVTSDLTAKIKAGDLVNHVASRVGGKGGGRPDMAQGGGTQPADLPKAMESLRGHVQATLGG